MFIAFGLYRGVWRYAGARDAASVLAAVVLSEGAAFLFIWATVPWNGFPRGTYLIDVILCTFLIGASRFSERAVARAISTLVGRGKQRRVLIVGAGRSGRSLLRELRETSGERVVGFVDDDPATLRRRRIQGVSVAGSLEEIGWILGRLSPDAVFVTIPDAPRDLVDGDRRGVRGAPASPATSSGARSTVDPAVAAARRRRVKAVAAPPRLEAEPLPRSAPAFADRLLVATPLVGIYVVLCGVYVVEVWQRVTPWLFTDELELTQLSRSIAEHRAGSPARGRPHSPDSALHLPHRAALAHPQRRDVVRRDQVPRRLRR